VFSDIHTDVRAQVGGVVILLAVSAFLLVAVVERSTMIRDLEVDVQARKALRDSLDAANSTARIDLVRRTRADRVFHMLEAAGFVVPDPPRIRFILYPGTVPGGDGVLTAQLASRLKDERQVLRGNEAWLWGWVRRLPALRDLGGGAS